MEWDKAYFVQYKWRPIEWKKCGMYGHQVEECKKGNGQQVWQEKTQQIGAQEQPVIPRRPGKEPMVQPTAVGNAFDMLQSENIPLVFGSVNPRVNSVLLPIDEGRGDDNMEALGDARSGAPPNIP